MLTSIFAMSIVAILHININFNKWVSIIMKLINLYYCFAIGEKLHRLQFG